MRKRCETDTRRSWERGTSPKGWIWALLVLFPIACSDSPAENAPPGQNPLGSCLVDGGELACAYSFDSIEALTERAAIINDKYWVKLIVPIKDKGCFEKPLFITRPDKDTDGDPHKEYLTAPHEKYLPLLYPDCFGHGTDEFFFHSESPNELHYYRGNLLYIENFEAAGYEVSGWPTEKKSLLAFELPFIDSKLEPLQVHVEKTRQTLLSLLPFADDIAFLPKPEWGDQINAAESWGGSIPVATESTTGAHAALFEIYNPGVAYGRMRFMTLDELKEAEDNHTLGYQDILSLWEAPYDIETIVSGVITAQKQGELSHLNIRSKARGTVNCFLKNLPDLVEFHEQLVRVECGSPGVKIEPTTQEEAEKWWAEWRPDPIEVPAIDAEHTTLDGLKEIPSGSESQKAESLQRFGAKAANLAWLYSVVDEVHQLQGFAIPFHYYEQFVTQSTGEFDLGDGPQTLTLQEGIDAMLGDPGFQSDTVLRAAWLEQLREAMKTATVSPALIEAISAKIKAVHGSTTTMVRFRSSSNAEDSCLFSGAGLYDSTSVCLADELDNDEVGPSLCDPDQKNERTVQRGLRKVWRSLWRFAAYEERDWFGIDQSAVAMGILVNTRSKNEQANIVAFSGNPIIPWQKKYLINAQVGEADVVTSEPGVFPEATFVTLSDLGQVELIERTRPSSLMPKGLWVVSDPYVTILAELLWAVDQDVSIPTPDTHASMLDTEWKILEDGRLIVKQVRPVCVPLDVGVPVEND